MAEKSRCPMHVGETLTFPFENATTIGYQIQQMCETTSGKRARAMVITHCQRDTVGANVAVG